MNKIREKQLYNELGDSEAVSANLEDVKDFVQGLVDDEFKTTIHFEDYDDYGCDHYVLVQGEIADIRIEKKYGGMFTPSDYLSCSISVKSNASKLFERKEEYWFKLKKEVKPVNISKNYEEELTTFINRYKKYLKADCNLFYRFESKTFNDYRGYDYSCDGNTFMNIKLTDDQFNTADNITADFSIRNIELYCNNDLNIVIDKKRALKENLSCKKIDEWDVIPYLVEDKKRLWVVDVLLNDDQFFYINEDGEVDATMNEEKGIVDFNIGKYKTWQKAKIIHKAWEKGINCYSLLVDVEVYESDVGKHFKFDDNSKFVIYNTGKINFEEYDGCDRD